MGNDDDFEFCTSAGQRAPRNRGNGSEACNGEEESPCVGDDPDLEEYEVLDIPGWCGEMRCTEEQEEPLPCIMTVDMEVKVDELQQQEAWAAGTERGIQSSTQKLQDSPTTAHPVPSALESSVLQ